ncbi:HNH endonuclease [Saccharothrix obliqua]|uniref:HNH endonuclease n=1 Tax=Saccharothrix obliqua TaxID=2861747 RepID=UPI001C605CD9|nr:hypothetical protein [Saccharothrix obliqua]MBW4722143.1 hypothetical protein [Saccharothrix obliqua]
MSADARRERASKNRRYLPHADSYVAREDYCQRWQVDPECVNADWRELDTLEEHIVRAAVYRLIALRQAVIAGERDRLPDPRLVNPEMRARTTRDVMDRLTRLLARFAAQARGVGWTWDELARSVTGSEVPYWKVSETGAFESVTGQPLGAIGMRTLTWLCRSCDQHITDRGPYGHPADCESGHAVDCVRHAGEVAAYERAARPVVAPMLLRSSPPEEEDTSTADLCRLIRSTRCRCAQCFYCERPLATRRHEHDHFPVPRSADGDRVVPACLDCHELKDTYPLRGWPHAELAAAWHGILACLDDAGVPDGEDLAHLGMVDYWKEQPDAWDEVVLAQWRQLRPLSRVLYAKVRAAKERHKRTLLKDTTGPTAPGTG